MLAESESLLTSFLRYNIVCILASVTLCMFEIDIQESLICKTCTYVGIFETNWVYFGTNVFQVQHVCRLKVNLC